jgi:hypothetical protein
MNMLNEMMRNGSGYPDFTAYNGMMNPNPGEIWTQGDMDDDYWVLLAVNNNVCTGLKLTNRDMDGSISVTCREVMYTNPAMMGYVFRNRLGCYVKTLPKKEFEDVRKAAADALGFTLLSAVPYEQGVSWEEKAAELHDTVIRLQEENKCLNKTVDLATAEIREYTDTIDDQKQEIASMNIYKAMYHELLDKLIAAKAGAVV